MKRKLFDEDGRLFGKISLVDVMAVCLVLLVAMMVYVRFFTGGGEVISGSSDVTFTYTIVVPEVRSFTVDAMKVGDELYVEDDGVDLGKITDIRADQCMSREDTPDGRVVLMPVEGRYDVTITVEATGLVSSGRYYAARSYELNPNLEVKFYSKYVSATGRVKTVG